MQRLLLLPVLLVSFTAGCGGGGSSAAEAPPIRYAPGVAASSANAVDFARVGMRSAFDLPCLAYIGASFLRRPVPEDPNATPSTAPLTLSAEVQGPNGGAAVYSWDDENADGVFSTGDVITIDFDAYADGDLTLSGVMVIEDLRTAGAVTQGGGTWIADATLRLLGVELQLGAGVFTMTADLPFRLENREVLEIFDLVVFEDLFVAGSEIKEGSSYRRYETDDDLSFQCFGYSYSPVLDAVVNWSTDSVVYLNTLTGYPVAGFVIVRGSEGTYVEVESQGGIGCTFPGFPLPCLFDVRGEYDGEEGVDETQQVGAGDFLPQ